MILDDFKNLLVQNNLATGEEVKYDFDSTAGENIVLIHLYNHLPCDLAMRSSLKITVKNTDLNLSRDLCFAIYNLLFPEDGFQKAVLINTKIMHTKLNKGPLYLEKDSSKRHNYVLDITVTYNR
jgi:hypothetical protein